MKLTGRSQGEPRRVNQMHINWPQSQYRALYPRPVGLDLRRLRGSGLRCGDWNAARSPSGMYVDAATGGLPQKYFAEADSTVIVDVDILLC